jgi:AsmA protein
MGSKPFDKDTLVSGKELAFGLNISSIFKANVTVDEFFLDEALVNIQVDSMGNANYNIYKPVKESSVPADSGSASLKIERIQITDSRLVYNDKSIPMQIVARDFNYTGKGDLSKAIFDLASKLEIGEFDFSYDGVPYVINKEIKAKLLTRINTNSLAFRFENNQLRINEFPVDFKGSFDIMRNGYALDLKFTSGQSTLHDLFTILPPGYLDWLSTIYMKGDAMVDASIAGNYNAETNSNPDINLSLQVRNGYIDHKNAPEALSGLYIDFKAKLPNLDTDSLQADLDSLGFNIGNDYLHAALHSIGLDQIRVNTHLNTKLDLWKFDQALAINMFEVKGLLHTGFTMDGVYSTGLNPAKLRPDTIITSIPGFHLQTSITNGYFKLKTLPQAINNIQLQLNSDCAGNDFHQTSISIKQLNASILNSFVKGSFNLGNLSNFPIKSDFESNINLADIQQALPLKDLKLSGKLLLKIKAEGEYLPSQNTFPKVLTTIQLDDGYLKTPYYPNPVTGIKIKASATDDNANLNDLRVQVEPLSFTFEGQPFNITAYLNNFNTLVYDIKANGILDIGKIYHVFAQKGMDASGYIEADLALKGSQADAAAGRYNRLSNSGTLKLKDTRLNYDAYPQPFYIESALFRFKNENICLENMLARYGTNHFKLDGYVFNVIDYVLKDAVLKGKIRVQSNKILVDEFMAFAGSAGTDSGSISSAGVVMVPSNLSVALDASAKEVLYNDLQIKDLKGTILMDSSKIKLKESTMRVAGAIIKMEASYASLNPQKAAFDFSLKADSFDIRRAYNEVKLFHDLASSAAKTKGIVSIDYQVNGLLNADMMPDYPTLKGGGVLRLEDIKVNGLKLFSVMSKSTGKDSINNPNLKKVSIKSTIANNVITIERVKMKIFGFRPRFEGQTSFDGRLNFKARLGLPPFGIFGIPMSITGTSSNPIIKMKKGTDEDLNAGKEETE